MVTLVLILVYRYKKVLYKKNKLNIVDERWNFLLLKPKLSKSYFVSQWAHQKTITLHFNSVREIIYGGGVSWRQIYSPGIFHNTWHNFQNVNILLARGKKITFVLFWSPPRWIFCNGGKPDMSCFHELFAKRLLQFCKYFFFNDIFLSFIYLMSIVSL